MREGLGRRCMGRARASWAGLVLFALVLAGWPPPASAQPGSLEYAVKATYLYKFAPFVAWRGAAAGGADLSTSASPGTIPSAPSWIRLWRASTSAAAPWWSSAWARAVRGMGCHVLYLGGSGGQSTAEALRAVRGEPVLTVTDAARHPDAKGVIHFWVSAGRVRFEIDPAAAAVQGLVVSSKLMALAARARA